MTPEQAMRLPTKVVEAHLCWLLHSKPHMNASVAEEFRALRPVWESRPRAEKYSGEKRDMRAKQWAAA